MKLSKRETLLLVLAALMVYPVVRFALPGASKANAQLQKFDRFDPDDFKPVQVVRPFEPIVNPKFVSAEEAVKQLRDDELVLGVEMDGIARAYPINMLTGPSREIFNDTLGAHAIAATW